MRIFRMSHSSNNTKFRWWAIFSCFVHFSSVFILFQLFFPCSWWAKVEKKNEREVEIQLAYVNEIFNLKRRNLELLGWCQLYFFIFITNDLCAAGNKIELETELESQGKTETRGKKELHTRKHEIRWQKTFHSQLRTFDCIFTLIEFIFLITEFSSLGWMSCSSKIATKSRAREKSQL